MSPETRPPAARSWVLRTCAALLLGGAMSAQAHKASDSYLRLAAEGSIINGQWDIALRDLDAVLALDRDGDGQLSWGEVRLRQSDIAQYAMERLTLSAGGGTCAPHLQSPLIDQHSDGAYVVLRFNAVCAQSVKTLRVGYRLFAEVDAGHRGLLNLSLGGRTYTAVFGPTAPGGSFSSLEEGGRWRQFAGFVRTGVDHIWTGYDHMLFLFSLLLPAVLLRRDRRWMPQPGLSPAFIDVCKIVTAFTVAHSITLSLATFGVVRLPARVSESAIALSVVIAALNNLFPLVRSRRWVVAFCFGLIHGFGFANVLNDLGLPASALSIALVGFNLGVEAGQLAIVAVFLPCAYALRDTLAYRRVLVSGGSVAIATIACLWLIERAFNLQFLPVH